MEAGVHLSKHQTTAFHLRLTLWIPHFLGEHKTLMLIWDGKRGKPAVFSSQVWGSEEGEQKCWFRTGKSMIEDPEYHRISSKISQIANRQTSCNGITHKCIELLYNCICIIIYIIYIYICFVHHHSSLRSSFLAASCSSFTAFLIW